MRSGHRGFLAPAIFGLVATSAGGGAWLASDPINAPTTYPAYRDGAFEQASTAPPSSSSRRVKRPEERQPCHDQRSREDSDLCAQWNAADAARDTAAYAYWQFWVSVAGVLGLAITLWFNLEAWRQARASEADSVRALELAERNAIATVKAANASIVRDRAWLSITGVFAETYVGILNGVPDEGLGFSISTKVINTGKTPALNVRVIAKAWIEERSVDPAPLDWWKDDGGGHGGVICPGDEVTSPPSPIAGHDAQRLIDGLHKGVIVCMIRYNDVYSDTLRETRMMTDFYFFNFQVGPDGKYSFYINSEIQARGNGAS